MKYITTDGKFWLRVSPAGNCTVGLTKQYCSKLGPLWHYLLKVEEGAEVILDQQLAAVEAFCSQTPIRSPVAGHLIHVSKKLEENPTEVSEEMSLFIFRDVQSFTHLMEVGE